MMLPKTRTENIVVQHLNDETLIYDLTAHKAFCLNETSAKVFNACDGETTFEELRRKYQLTDEIIYLSLDELKKNNLLKTEYVSPFAGMSRREVVRKIGLTSLIALPMISALVAPTAAHAQSGVCSSGCFAAGTDACAGCTGFVTFVRYQSTDGSCTGVAQSTGVVDCGLVGTVIGTRDIQRN